MALTRQPTLGFQQLAELVGVSRGTIYRLAPSRDALLMLLANNSLAATRAALDDAGIDNGPPVEVLERLTHRFVDDAELYAFWLGELRQRISKDSWIGELEGEWAFYKERMTAFFRRAQAEGVLRMDVPAEWLLQSYDFQLYAVASGILLGTIAPTNAAELVVKTFIDGARQQSGKTA